MPKTIQPISPVQVQCIKISDGLALKFNSLHIQKPETDRLLGEKEKAEYIKTLDDLCAVLDSYSAALTKNISKMADHRRGRE